ncbi:hypothetical protein [Shewanella sp.]|uniref:hypothetical protein n=1 Tax=Shewanella sp. TaxID=50422 RepID=UPI003562B398
MQVKITTNRAGLTVYKPATGQPKRLESLEQQDLNSHCALLWPVEYQSMFHVVNEGKSSGNYNSILNRRGRKKGVPDWHVAVPSNGYHGLYVELKQANAGSASKEQKEFLLRQQDLGYKCVIAHGFRAALEAIKDYLTTDK